MIYNTNNNNNRGFASQTDEKVSLDDIISQIKNDALGKAETTCESKTEKIKPFDIASEYITRNDMTENLDESEEFEVVNGRMFQRVISDELVIQAQTDRRLEYESSPKNESYSDFCKRNSLSKYISKSDLKTKTKRYIVAPYADDFITNVLYSYAFKVSARAIRKWLLFSESDSRLIPLYTNCLRRDKFENHNEDVCEYVQTTMTNMLGYIRREVQKAKKIQTLSKLKADGVPFILRNRIELLLEKIDEQETQIQIVDVKISPKTNERNVLVVVSGDVQIEIDLDDNYPMFLALMKSDRVWFDKNSYLVRGYNRNGKSETQLRNDLPLEDARTAEEMLDVEVHNEWLRRRELVMKRIAKSVYEGEFKVYSTILDLMARGIIPLSLINENGGLALDEWIVSQIEEGLKDSAHNYHTKQVWKSVSKNGSCKNQYDVEISYMIGRERKVLSLNLIKARLRKVLKDLALENENKNN